MYLFGNTNPRVLMSHLRIPLLSLKTLRPFVAHFSPCFFFLGGFGLDVILTLRFHKVLYDVITQSICLGMEEASCQRSVNISAFQENLEAFTVLQGPAPRIQPRRLPEDFFTCERHPPAGQTAHSHFHLAFQ